MAGGVWCDGMQHAECAYCMRTKAIERLHDAPRCSTMRHCSAQPETPLIHYVFNFSLHFGITCSENLSCASFCHHHIQVYEPPCGVMTYSLISQIPEDLLYMLEQYSRNLFLSVSFTVVLTQGCSFFKCQAGHTNTDCLFLRWASRQILEPVIPLPRVSVFILFIRRFAQVTFRPPTGSRQ